MIGLVASILGAVAGLGGGVVIKPLLDFFGHYDLATIGVLSSATVMSMAIVSLIKAKINHVQINIVITSTITLGAIIGGVLGKGIFNYLLNTLNILNIIGIFQSSLLALLMIIILLLTRYSHLVVSNVIRNKVAIFLIGLTLGVLSAFLGIGGGPLNVVVLSLLFSMSPKESSINSIFIIFFSQLAALALTSIDTGFSEIDVSMLPYIILGGTLGGWIGSSLTNRLLNRQVQMVFSISIFLILLINIYNIVTAL